MGKPPGIIDRVAKPPATLTTAQVARALGVSPRRVRQVKDRIGCFKHGAQLAFLQRDVDRYKAKGKA